MTRGMRVESVFAVKGVALLSRSERRRLAERKWRRNSSSLARRQERVNTFNGIAEMLGELFDPRSDFTIEEHFRPHWSQAGAIVFITFRANDSIPRQVLQRWEREKRDWIHRLGHTGHWSDVLPTLESREQVQFKRHFNRCREEFLDGCHGKCMLRQPELAKIVADSLMHFDGDRYRMGDFVVMPNHVHLLAAFPTEGAMKGQCDSWLHYTAFQINKRSGQKGKFWQQEPFDHLVRSIRQYEYLRRYISENPAKARLEPGHYYFRRFGA